MEYKNKNGRWRTRTNKEIDDLLERDNLVCFIKMRRLAWFNHVEKMRDGRVPKSSCVETCMMSGKEDERGSDGSKMLRRTYMKWVRVTEKKRVSQGTVGGLF